MSRRQFRQTGFRKETLEDFEKLQRTQALFAKMSKRPRPGSFKQPKNVARFKTSRRGKQSTVLKAKIGAIENKYKDNSQSNAAISQAVGGSYLETNTGGLCCPTQGDDVVEREGRSIQVTSFEIKGQILFPSAEAIGDIALFGQQVQLSLVQDTQSNGTAATTTNVYSNTTGTIYGQGCHLRNPVFANRFKILKTETFERPVSVVTQNANNDFSYSSAGIPFHWYVKLKKPVRVKFNSGAGSGVIADIIDNSFHVWAATGGDNNAVGVTTRMDATLTYNSRARFFG